MERLVRLGTDDAGEALTLQRAAYVTEAQAHSDLNLPPLRQDLNALIAELGDPHVLALGWREANGRLVAAVRARRACDPHEAWAEIGRLTVAPDRQGQGLGSGLLAALEDRLPADVTELRLFTGEKSHDNLRLYYRLDFIETTRQPTPAGTTSFISASRGGGPADKRISSIRSGSTRSDGPKGRVDIIGRNGQR